MEKENEILWQGDSYGMTSRILGNIGLASATYLINNNELIIKEGIFKRNTIIISLNNLGSVKLVETLYQRLIKVGTIYLTKKDDGKVVILKNLKNPEKARQKIEKILQNLQ